MTATRDAATTYFTSWNSRNFTALRAVLADGVSFRGPMGTADGAEQCIRGLQAARGMVDEIVVTKIWTDGPDAITWFELRRDGSEPIPTVNWSHVEDGVITRIRVTFDPRPLLPPSG